MASFKPIANTRSATGIPTGKLAIWWLLSSEIVIFGGVLMSYLMHRLSHDEWALESVHTSTLHGGINTFVLLTSSLSAVLAHNEAEQGNGKGAAKYLYFTIGGALLFLLIKSHARYNEISHGYTISKSAFWSFYYVAAGIHASHVIGGAIVMLFVARDAAQNKELHRVEDVGLYWHFVDLVWIFLFPLLYIAK